jgi:A/G-specific adenine glycosylase
MAGASAKTTTRPAAKRSRERDRAIARAVERWFAANARELPWRRENGSPGPRRDPYRALVCEAMLQQTQVSRVVARFTEFMDRFPTVRTLAGATEDDVLALWSGLGYYRRARHLHAAARAIVERHGGVFPADIDQIRALPGVGRYTAGAIASMALGQREPLVDGNVARVLLRIEGREGGSGDRATDAWAWSRAADLVGVARDPGRFNEGLMELGALVCVPPPGAPRCGQCPLAKLCIARREGRQLQIPAPKPRARQKTIHCASVLIRDRRGRLAVEQRGREGGMWAGMWQAPTLERADRAPRRAEILAWLDGSAGAAPSPLHLRVRRRFIHQTTHRRLRFDVWELVSSATPRTPPRGRWMTAGAIASLGLSSVQREILLGSGGDPPSVPPDTERTHLDRRTPAR